MENDYRLGFTRYKSMSISTNLLYIFQVNIALFSNYKHSMTLTREVEGNHSIQDSCPRDMW